MTLLDREEVYMTTSGQGASLWVASVFFIGQRKSSVYERSSYHIDFGPKNDDIGAENGYLWNNNIEISI
jgi:hypothetical protein